MENIENRSKSHNPGANIVILPGREEKRTKETENWSKQFNQMRAAQQRKLAEDNEKMKVVQNRLLALVGGNGAPGSDCYQFASSPEASGSNTSKNANLVPVIPKTKKKSRLELRKEHVGVLDDNLIEKIRTGPEAEKQQILKNFNIVEIQPPEPNKNIIEVNLLDDSDDDIGKYSDGSPNTEEEDDDEEEIEILEGDDISADGVSNHEPFNNVSVPTEARSLQEDDDDNDEIVILEN